MKPARPSNRLVLVDAGNTTCSVAVTVGARLKRVGAVLTASASPAAIRALLRKVSGGRSFDGAALCSVVPAVNAAWLEELARVSATKPLRILHHLDFGIAIRYPKPGTIGADRLVNAAAAAARYPAPVVAMDFGTALTCDVVSADGAFIGGIIAPGMRMLMDALHERTALLPRVEFGPVRRMVGRSTREAMRIGAGAGYAGLVRELMNGLHRELGPAVRFCATGGDAPKLSRILGERCPVVPLLTFEGIRLVFERNRPEGES